MEAVRQNPRLYSPEWFTHRALSGLRKIGDDSWDYSDSLLLYVPGSDDEYEAVQEIDTPYHTLITAPERKSLQDIAPEIVNELSNTFEYVDMGPGTEHKEQFIFDAAKEQGKQILYRPTDISDKYLQLSTAYASNQGLKVEPIKSSFEELPEKLNEVTNQRFVSLGLTYGNYNPPEILELLKEVAGKEGVAFINAQIRERADMEAIKNIYAEAAPALVAAKIRMLGLDPEKDISESEVTDEVKIWYTLSNSSAALEAKGMKVGDRLLVFQSLRPTLERLKSNIAKVFPDYKLLDNGESFVGALLFAAK
ncbi:MAG: hypothetical protein JWL75_788 [Parcubacteria group bacterium]|nr:hypothetical protein [Parcubacteria group bacterium]